MGDVGCAGRGVTMSDPLFCTATFTTEELLLDNGQGGTSFTGTWTVSTDPASYGGDSLVANGAGIETYRWTPSIPVTREYRSEERRVGKEGRSRWSPDH